MAERRPTKIVKHFTTLLFAMLCFVADAFCAVRDTTTYSADNVMIEYVGRIDFAKKDAPRFWAPGVYVRAAFEGTYCHVQLRDEILWGKSHNYISVVIDDRAPARIRLTKETNTLKFDHLGPGRHAITICKSTEANIGYVEFVGLRCEKLVKLKRSPVRRIEFIGNSITCGMGSDETSLKCGEGEWYDQHNAYLSYGPLTARALDAQWMLTSYSGIGLIHSCCDLKSTMPGIFDRTDLRENGISWDFAKYTPDVVTVCLGQNDGIQDSTAFCGAYVDFVNSVRKRYPAATIVLLSSPMADDKLLPVMKTYIASVEGYVRSAGDRNLHHYFFGLRYVGGCGSHPNLADHRAMADELTSFLKKLKNW